jgi:uncharacterized protein with HEPN domain
MSRSVTDLVQHMFDETEYLIIESQRIDQRQFLADETRQRAFVRSIEILGEAAKGVPISFRGMYPEVPWQSIAGMRDRLIHGYFAVDYDIVWDVVANKVPALRNQLRQILDAERS